MLRTLNIQSENKIRHAMVKAKFQKALDFNIQKKLRLDNSTVEEIKK